MIYFAWTSDIEIGHPEIDEQHKQLFLLGEAVVESLNSSGEQKPTEAQLQVFATQLKGFIAYAQEHFKYEEGLMRSVGYPEAERHAKYHASLLTELIMHCNKVNWGENTNPVDLTSFLWNWLILHIDLADREVVVWLKSQEPNVV